MTESTLHSENWLVSKHFPNIIHFPQQTCFSASTTTSSAADPDREADVLSPGAEDELVENQR